MYAYSYNCSVFTLMVFTILLASKPAVPTLTIKRRWCLIYQRLKSVRGEQIPALCFAKLLLFCPRPLNPTCTTPINLTALKQPTLWLNLKQSQELQQLTGVSVIFGHLLRRSVRCVSQLFNVKQRNIKVSYCVRCFWTFSEIRGRAHECKTEWLIKRAEDIKCDLHSRLSAE